MSTLQIIGNMIVINIPEDSNDFDNGEKQKVVILANHLGGFNINYTGRTITLYLTLKGMYSYLVDFNRGTENERLAEANFNAALNMLGGNTT